MDSRLKNGVTKDHLEALKKRFYETQVKVTDEDAAFIAQQTKEQVKHGLRSTERD